MLFSTSPEQAGSASGAAPRPQEKAAPAIGPAMAEAMALFDAGHPLSEIRALTGVTHQRLYATLDRRARATGQALPRRRTDRPPRTGLAPPVGALVSRLWNAAERQVRDIETRFGLPGEAAGDPEKNARALAVLSKVVRELVRASQQDQPTAPTRAARPDLDEEDDDAPPRDLDALREELARRLERLRAERDAQDIAPETAQDSLKAPFERSGQ